MIMSSSNLYQRARVLDQPTIAAFDIARLSSHCSGACPRHPNAPERKAETPKRSQLGGFPVVSRFTSTRDITALVGQTQTLPVFLDKRGPARWIKVKIRRRRSASVKLRKVGDD